MFGRLAEQRYVSTFLRREIANAIRFRVRIAPRIDLEYSVSGDMEKTEVMVSSGRNLKYLLATNEAQPRRMVSQNPMNSPAPSPQMQKLPFS